MKKLLSLIIPLFLLSACTSVFDKSLNEALRTNAVGNDNVFYATLEESGEAAALTKVYTDKDMRVLWNADDRISIFNKINSNQEYRFLGKTGDNAGEFKPVSPDAPEGSSLPYVYAVYPYLPATGIDSEGRISLTLPASQTYQENSFGPSANAMVSVTEDNHLQFKNVGGYLSFKLYYLYGTGVSVKSITLKGNNHEKLAGAAVVTMSPGGTPLVTMSSEATESVTLTCDEAVALSYEPDNYTEFWFVLPPTDFTKGFTITVFDDKGDVFRKSTHTAISIHRNTISRMKPIGVVPVNPVWSLIGDWSVWSEDMFMAEIQPGIWTSPRIDCSEGIQFKIRYGENWEYNLGGHFQTFGTPFTGVYDGENISVSGAQCIQVTLDINDWDNPSITINQVEPQVWSVIGNFNDWADDLVMTETTFNVWTSPTFTTRPSNDTGFRVRLNKAWDTVFGGTFGAFGTPFPAFQSGADIVVGDDKSVQVTLDLTDADHPSITVNEVAKPVTWSLIGAFNGWNDDLFMSETNPGIWVSPFFTTAEDDDGFVIRRDSDWDISFGGSFVEFNTPFAAANGVNIQVGNKQDVKVKLDLTDPDNPMITVSKSPVNAWSVIGSFNGWLDDLVMTETEPGIWVSPDFDDGDFPNFKLRFNGNWENNLGGNFAAYGTPFPAVAGGDNIAPDTRAVVRVTLNLTVSGSPTITVSKP